MAHVVVDLLHFIRNCLSCFPASPSLRINNRSFKIQRLLGEGGFSYVYLVQDTDTLELLALKKIRCPFGVESVSQALREVDAYRLFAHVNSIIHMVDHAVAKDRGGGTSGIGSTGAGESDEARTVYILLPYYRRGNLQDVINANLVNRAHFPERRLMVLFLRICLALRHMHKYIPPAPGAAAIERMEMGDEVAAASRASGRRRLSDSVVEEDERPLMESSHRVGDSEVRSYAHRDIKPGNIMIDDSGLGTVLMDLGSVAPSPLAITSHSLAIATQDTAAEHSTMPYRAPELFDVRNGAVIDTAVDIWSLGCTLYACLIGKSPFEMRSDETGGSLSLCVLGGDWRFPDEGGPKASAPSARANTAAVTAASTVDGGSTTPQFPVSQPVRDIVRRCLRVEPSERPDIDQLIALVERVIDEMPEDGPAAAVRLTSLSSRAP